jgi:cytochrome c biogenesis protein CcmG/thiol:disulfide interchange protein DsbE
MLHLMTMKALAREDSVSSAIYTVAGALLIIGLLAGFAWLPRVLGARAEKAGGDAPAISVPILENAAELVEPPALAPATVNIGELKGHAVLLDFWATWCGPCQAQAPIVNHVAVRYKSRGLVVVGIDTSDPDGLSLAGPWAKSHKITYPIAFDSGAAARAYDVENLPTLVVISKAGKIVGRRMGMTDGDEIERLVNQAL